MSGAHSVLPPSGGAEWELCAMWPRMTAAYPKPDTPESLEGNAAHWVFAEMLAGRQVAEGMMAPNGQIVTDEMIEGAELFVEATRERISGTHTMLVETPIACPSVHAQCWGTPDLWGFSDPTMTLDILDYKFGHRFVDEYENRQGIIYASGVLDHLAAARGVSVGAIDQAITFRFTIVQPRCFYKGSPVRTWTVRASDLRAHINILAMAANKALGANPEAVTNDGCRDCAGRHACAALHKAAYSDAEFAVASVPVELSPLAADLELRMLERASERLTARVEGLRETCIANAKAGHALPYHHLEQGFARQQWTFPPEQVIGLGQAFGIDLAKPAVKTPKQAAKLGIDEAVIKAYSVTPSGQIKLLPDNPADARRVFGATK